MVASKTKAFDLSASRQFFYTYMPYCFERLSAPAKQHLYLPLNRHYKPLGISESVWVNYEDHRGQAVLFARDPRKFKDVWWDAEHLYLYNDGRRSLEDYFVRLQRLFEHVTRDRRSRS